MWSYKGDFNFELKLLVLFLENLELLVSCFPSKIFFPQYHYNYLSKILV